MSNPALQPPVLVNPTGAAAPAAPAPNPAPAAASVPPAPRVQPTPVPVRQPATAPAVPATTAPAAAAPVPQPQAAAVPAAATPAAAPAPATVQPVPAAPQLTRWQNVCLVIKGSPWWTAATVLVLLLLLLVFPLVRNGNTAVAATETKAAREEAAKLAMKVGELESKFNGVKASEDELKRQAASREETVKQLQQQLAVKPAVAVDPTVETLKAKLAEFEKARLVSGSQTPPRAELVTTTNRTEETFKSTSSGQQGGRSQTRQTGSLEQALIEGLKNRTARVDLGTGRVIFKGDEDKNGAGLPFVQIYRWAKANGYNNFRLNDPEVQADILRRYGDQR